MNAVNNITKQFERFRYHGVWFVIRIGLCLGAFLLAFLTLPDAEGVSPVPPIMVAVLFVLPVLWVPLVCVIEMLTDVFAGQAIWRRPSLWISPFAKHNPLQFWFFCPFLITSFGGGIIARELISGTFRTDVLIQTITPSTGLLLGVALSLLIWQRRFEGKALRDEK